MALGIDLPPFNAAGSDVALLAAKLVAETLVTSELVLLLDVPRSEVRVELILMSCSRLFTATSWLTYSLGSVFAVGSWFFSSVTSKVRKSLEEIEAAELLSLLELPSASCLAVLPVAADAIGVAAVLPARACAAAMR
jgi:hypothetical protein